MTPEDFACRYCPAPHRILPPDVIGGEVDLGDNEIHHPVEQFVLSGDVVVERRGLDAEPSTELAHGDRLDAALVGEIHRRAHHALSVERVSRFAVLACCSSDRGPSFDCRRDEALFECPLTY
jgi:hypothetical protein